MLKKDMFSNVKKLPFDKKEVVYKIDNTELYILRPTKKFKDYDKRKNFQVWLKEGDREFKPNHLRLFIDLNLRIRSRPDLKIRMLQAFDNIFYGSDPEEELEELSKENFDHFLNDIRIIGVMAQLFIIEQEYCYSKESNYDPPTLFFQGWVRQFIDSPKEIDNMCMSVANYNSPAVRYTRMEDKKHKKYQPNLKPLWYIDDFEQDTLQK
jgi:hypothetical protein